MRRFIRQAGAPCKLWSAVSYQLSVVRWWGGCFLFGRGLPRGRGWTRPRGSPCIMLPASLRGLSLECGQMLAPVELAYRTYGTAECGQIQRHSHLPCTDRGPVCGGAASADRQAGAGGTAWWGRGGRSTPTGTLSSAAMCWAAAMGSTGPGSLRPDGTPWDAAFPPITIGDMVRAQGHAGGTAWHRAAVFRGGAGPWAACRCWNGWRAFRSVCFPPCRWRRRRIIRRRILRSTRSAGKAIFSDPDFRGGRYEQEGVVPARGLGGGADDGAHHLFVEAALTRKFGRRTRRGHAESATLFDEVFEVESYLRHQGSSFVSRFDANSYLTITRRHGLVRPGGRA